MSRRSQVQGGGNRLRWIDLPSTVQARIERMARGEVVAAESAHGGFSPGLASSLTLDDGRRVFAKAISDEVTPGAAAVYRREGEIVEALAGSAPTASLLARDEVAGWIVLVYEHIEGRHPDPSIPGDLAAIHATFDGLATALDPSPLARPRIILDPVSTRRFDSWHRESERESEARTLHPWIGKHFPAVLDAASRWREAADGTALVHGDLRPDNMLLTASGTVVVLDWPESVIGAPWLDFALGIPSLAMFEGAPPVSVLADRPLLNSVDPAHLAAVVAAMCGFFLCASVQPPIPALPTLRDFQRAQGMRAADWLASLLG